MAVSSTEVASDRYSEVVARKCERDRSRYGSTMFVSTFDPDGGEVTGTSLVMALDAPVVHLATSERNKLKFKAGAELSKAVN